MKRILSFILIITLLAALCGCRVRVTVDSGDAVCETVEQPVPTPMEGQGQQVPDEDKKPDPNEEKTENDAKGERVDDRVSAEGGEISDDADDVQTGEEITVYLDAQGGSCAKEQVTLRVGGVYGVLPTPEYAGQTFRGWFLQAEGGDPVNEITVVLKNADHSLYAQWTTQVELTLTFDPNGGRISPYSASKQILSGTLYGQLPQPLRDGYTFLGWFTQAEGGEQISSTDMVTVIEDQTLYAHWEYSPLAYWSFVLKNTTQRIFDCQERKIYLELEAKGSTLAYTPLIDEIGAQNIAQKGDAPTLDDKQIASRKPNVIVKITEDMSLAEVVQSSVEKRFPGTTVYVFPKEALEGSDAEQLWYRLRLAALCYPGYYSGIDFDIVAQELGVSAYIHS